MAKKVFFILLAGIFLASVLAFAEQPQKSTPREADVATAIRSDANWAVRDGQPLRVDMGRENWMSSKFVKQFPYDTLLKVGFEGPSWNDLIAGTPWDTVDNTIPWADTMWHRDTFKAISGTYSMWWGDPEINGYQNDRYQALIGPKMFIKPANTWTKKSPATSPTAREDHAMAYVGDDQVLLFGGDDGALDDSTWVYDLSANTWTKKSPATSPTARENHAMAYIGDDQVLLFGGDDGALDDSTWVYDLSDNTWTKKSPATNPSARETHTMADLGSDQVLLFGGDDGALDDSTWVYNLSGDDSLFMTYTHLIRCEEMSGIGQFEGWDGYNVRIKVAGKDTMYEELPPYKVAADSSYYTHPPQNSHEWNILRCWERHGEMTRPGGGYGTPYDQWIGGFANDNDSTTQAKTFDLRSFVGDTIQICFVGASDWGACTIDATGDSSYFGYIIDNVLVKDLMDDDTLMFDDFESAKGVAWTLYTPNVPTGQWWWLSADTPHGGIYKAWCGNTQDGAYPENCENAIESPVIYRDDLDPKLASLKLHWFLKAQMTDAQAEECGAYNQYKLDDGEWNQISVLTGPSAYYFGLSGVTNSAWWNTDQWSTFMTNMSPLITDTTIVWDSLQVRIGFFSNTGADTAGTKGLQVDDVTLTGLLAEEYDLGVYSLKIPTPNTNDVPVTFDSVTIYNYGFNAVSSSEYQVYMSIVNDTNGVVMFGPTQVLDFTTAPAIPALSAATAALYDTATTITLDSSAVYDIKIYTYWPQDVTNWNDTLIVFEHTSEKQEAYVYPYYYHYPAGQGALRYHDQGLYYYPYINITTMEPGEIAAVHFTPDSSLYPFDMRLALVDMADSNKTFYLKVWGSGNTPPEAPLLATVPFNPSVSERIELDEIDALKDISSDFWMGVDFPTGCQTGMGVEIWENESEANPGRNWGHSYQLTDSGWVQYEYDWMITAVVSWHLTNSLGIRTYGDSSLRLDWVSVAALPSQTTDAGIFRGTATPLSLYDTVMPPVASYVDDNGAKDLNNQYYYFVGIRHIDGGVYESATELVGEFDRYLKKSK